MTDLREYITSGLIEKYVLGLALPEEITEIEAMAIEHPEIELAISDFCTMLEKNAMANAITPPEIIKPELMATIDYMERLKKSQVFSKIDLNSHEKTLQNATQALRFNIVAKWLPRNE